MAVPEIRGVPLESLPWPVSALVDEMVALYADWRQDAQAATDAYARWSAAPVGEWSIRHSAYVAALDREHAAAGQYARAVAEVELWVEKHQP
jgi:hypothetical protein